MFLIYINLGEGYECSNYCNNDTRPEVTMWWESDMRPSEVTASATVLYIVGKTGIILSSYLRKDFLFSHPVFTFWAGTVGNHFSFLFPYWIPPVFLKDWDPCQAISVGKHSYSASPCSFHLLWNFTFCSCTIVFMYGHLFLHSLSTSDLWFPWCPHSMCILIANFDQ